MGRASNATIQPLIKLQNKAIKILNPTNMGSLEEHFQHFNILCLPKLYSFSVDKFMDSYHNKLLPNHIDEYFVSLSSLLNSLAQKYGLQHQTILNFQPPLPLNGNLRNTSYMKKIPNYEL